MDYRRAKYAVLCIAVLASFASRPVAAQQGEIRRITPTEATSNCIGDPKSPICAVETFLACFEWEDLSLCQRVGVPQVSFVCGGGTTEYRIVSERTVGIIDPAPDLKGIRWDVPGAVRYDLLERYPTHSRSHCVVKKWLRYTYWVGKSQGRWRIISWDSESNSL